MKQKSWNILKVILSIVLAAICVGITGNIFDKYRLAYLNTWALMHGMVFIIYPLYVTTIYYILNFTIGRFIKISDRPEIDEKETKFNKLSIVSILLSSLGMMIPFVSIGGIISGHLTRIKCKKQPNLTGSGLALFGLILGYASVAFHTYVLLTVMYVAKNSS